MSKYAWIALVAATLLAFSPAAAATEAGEFYLERYQGLYSVDCSDEKAEQIEIRTDRLIDRTTEHELSATDVDASVSYYGRMTPDAFRVALLAHLKSESAIYLVYENDRGVYIELEDVDEVRYLRCDDGTPEREEKP